MRHPMTRWYLALDLLTSPRGRPWAALAADRTLVQFVLAFVLVDAVNPQGQYIGQTLRLVFLRYNFTLAVRFADTSTGVVDA